jgi:predicted ATPase
MSSDPPRPAGAALPSAGHTLPAGMRLGGHVVERVLGEGGFGIVYLVADPADGRRLAVKEYLPSQMASRAADGVSVAVKAGPYADAFAAGLRSFVNEARLLSRFKHPALLEVLRFWEEHGTAYMLMPFYEGPTLKQQLQSPRVRPSEAQVREWLLPLLDGLELLHAERCYHRDIAPDNILLTKQGPVLIDFGAARQVVGDLTHALTAVLKPGFAPIEQYGQEPGLHQGPWTDLFALAGVLYVVIGGVRPQPSAERVLHDRLQPLAELAAGRLPRAFLQAVDLALAVRPEHRPQSVAEFRSLLDDEALGDARRAALDAALEPRTVFAPARTPDHPHNLPLQRTSFVGRETEVAEVKALLEQSPLVSVLGMGGLGKTRLTLRAASELLPRFADGAWFVDLTAVSDPNLVVSAAARTFDLHDEPGRPLVEVLCAFLKPRRALLLLDNCEHVLDAAAALVDALLAAAPHVRVLASSREPLDVPGEQCYPIRPLPMPPPGADLDALRRSPAARMFADRARAQQPSFALDREDPAMLAELMARLEGIPLAIELAAARLRTLAVPEILAGLDDRYQLLAGGSRLLQRRQQTLRALVDWSYDLLDDEEQGLLARLAVFAGGFDTAAAQAVCADEVLPAARVVPLLDSLVQKSLVQKSLDTGSSGQGSSGRREAGDDPAHDAHDAPRFRMLETLRDYAREKLAEQDPAHATEARHGAHFLELAKAASRGMHGAGQGRFAAQLERELDNLRAAAAHSLAGGDPFVAIKLAVALTGFWILRGHPSEGRRLMGAALATPAVQASDLARAWALYTSATLAGAQGDHVAAIDELEQCLALRRRMGNSIEIAATLSTLALARLQAGAAQGAAAHEMEALQLFADAGDKRGQAIGRLHLGQIHLWAGDAASAKDDLALALGLAREVGNREIEAEAELTAAEACTMLGQRGDARGAVARSLRVCQEAGDKRGEASARWWQGRLALEAGEARVARSALAEAMAAFQAQEMRAQMLGCLDDLALLRRLEGAPAAALELAAASDLARRRLLLRRSPHDEQRWAGQLAALRAELGSEAAETAARSGRALGIDQAVKAALAAPVAPVAPGAPAVPAAAPGAARPSATPPR